MTFGSWNKIKKGLLKAKPKKFLSDDPIETCEYDPAGYNSYYPPDDDTDFDGDDDYSYQTAGMIKPLFK